MIVDLTPEDLTILRKKIAEAISNLRTADALSVRLGRRMIYPNRIARYQELLKKLTPP